MFSLLLLALLGGQMVLAYGVLTNQWGSSMVPSADNLTGCRRSCGNLTFEYPFGIGAGCFRGAGFELICNESALPPVLLLRDGITQVAYNIVTSTLGYPYGYQGSIGINIASTIPLRYGVSTYNMSWDSPWESFAVSYASWNVTGCDLDVFFLNRDANKSLQRCSLTCPSGDITDMMVIRQSCNGTGCCSINWPAPIIGSLELKFVKRNKTYQDGQVNRSSIWSYINVTTDYMGLSWSIIDQPNCAIAMLNNTTFACSSKNSYCVNNQQSVLGGYFCNCNPGYVGNPYHLDGCSRDKGYDAAAQQKTNCNRMCGNISVPFPFGVEEGCSAREEFYLNCTNMTTSTLLLGYNTYLVTEIDLDEGLIKYIQQDKQAGWINLVSNDDPGIFITSAQLVSMNWVVANLSCPEAKANRSGYACVSTNSDCVPVNYINDGYVGYRCKCSSGFKGNPYLQSGCQDINECREPNRCKGICQNTIGSFNCAKCPPKTMYDPVKMKCSSVKKGTVLFGIIIGLSCGFTVLFISICSIYLTRRWKTSRQKRLRKIYFRRNKGLLLEQLISSKENACEETNIFSLEELEKATNNFDSTRILGRGGHGMVYKGILSDKRVVAIKKSKIIEEGEINQFINEVVILSQINHRNIVKLFGCCLETEVPLLVYDFIPNGSLYDILHSNANNDFVLSWDSCLRIAAEAAGALCYLHSAASVSVFHRDVKSSNILLDSNYTAKVSDFGASRLVPIDQTHIVTNIQGTFGYLDPEYYHTGQLNEKSDVYSFGVVLLELLIRKEPIITTESGTKQNLANYFLWEMKGRPIIKIVAPQVLEEATEEEISCVASIVEMCLRLQGDKRPTMKQVEMALQFLRSKRMELNQASTWKDEQRQSLLTQSDISSYQLSAIGFGKTSISSSSRHSKKFYSLEQEFLSTVDLPR